MNRAKSIAAMGLVIRKGETFEVSTPNTKDKSVTYMVRRNDAAKVVCNCQEFEDQIKLNPSFRCEHILAVKESLTVKNTVPDPDNKTSVLNKNSTQQASAPDDQINSSESTKLKPAVEDLSFYEPIIDGQMSLNPERFAEIIAKLSLPIDQSLIKNREGWKDNNGNIQVIEYVEWHTVADILDKEAPGWSHIVRSKVQIGDILTVTAGIVIEGIVREGIGTGSADSEMGIKKAEHDALKRAAVKFGIARELYKKEADISNSTSTHNQNQQTSEFPSNPIARSLSDLVTAKQLGMLRALAREANIDENEECEKVMKCKSDELSKKSGIGIYSAPSGFDKRI